jgi:hypothetical protein
MGKALEGVWDKHPDDIGRFPLLSISSFRSLISGVGVDMFHLTLFQVDGGYELRARTGFNRVQKGWIMKAEKSPGRRLFKTPQAAFRVAAELGFDFVEVKLSSRFCSVS